MLGHCVICSADCLNDESICDAPDCRDEYEVAMEKKIEYELNRHMEVYYPPEDSPY